MDGDCGSAEDGFGKGPLGPTFNCFIGLLVCFCRPARRSVKFARPVGNSRGAFKAQSLPCEAQLGPRGDYLRI